MKLHLPYMLRCALLSAIMLPAQAALTWNSGLWNTTDASWLNDGASSVFSQGDAVEFTNDAEGFQVTITEMVAPSSVLVSGQGYIFEGSGSISGETSLVLENEASLKVQNTNAFTGGTIVSDGAVLTLSRYDSIGSVNAGERALGMLSGGGEVNLMLENAGTLTSITGQSFQNFTGVFRISRGNLGLGRKSDHSGPGAVASLNASRVEVGAEGTFITSMGGGTANLSTGRTVTPDISTVSGATIGNRDGHVNWTGDITLNLQSLDSTESDTSGTTSLSLYYGKYVVWNGQVSGSGVLDIRAGVPDTGADHRLVLTNGENTFSGTYRISSDYLTTLALTSPGAASAASVQLDSANARLLLMDSSASVVVLNGSAGSVLASGSGNYTLTVGSGAFAGSIKDAASATAGLTLGITKTGTGNLNLSGEACSYTGVTSVQGGVLSFSGNATLGSIAVVADGAQLSTAGNLTLRSGASLAFDVEGSQDAAISVGGAFALTDAQTTVSLSGYESLGIGNYDLITWGAAPSVVTSQFYSSGLNDTAEKAYSVRVQGNALQLVVGSMSDVPWLWIGDTGTWSDTSSAEWQNADGSGPAGQVVTFAPGHDGTVTVSQVTPASIRVTGGRYRFEGDSAGIISSGDFIVSGDDTLVQLALANPGFSGNLRLQGGTLEIDAEGALGTASIYFNGGQLRYGSGITQDLSSRLNAASSSMVRVDTNGNTVTWADDAGVKQSLTHGVEKNGAGELTLNWQSAGETQSGNFMVNDGVLRINKVSGQGTLSGSFIGEGTLVLTSASGQLTVQGNHTGFAGTLELAGDGSPSSGSVSFYDGAAMGGSGTLVRVAGQRFWFSRATTTAANLEIVDGTTTYLDGSTGQHYTFTGALSGAGTMILKPSSHITMSGDVSAFTGTLEHPGNTAVNWTFGGENVAGSGLVQANLSSTGANMTFNFQYSSPTTMSGAVGGSAMLRQSGSGVLTLTGQNTTTGSLTIDTDCEIRLGSSEATASWAGTSLQGGGRLTLVNGSLIAGLSTLEGELVADVAEGARVDMGGMDANVLESISIAENGHLGGISGNLNIGSVDGVEEMNLTLGSANVGSTSSLGSESQVMLDITNGKLLIHDSTTVELDMESVRSLLEGKRQAVYLYISNAELDLQNGITADDLFANSSTSPAALGLTVLGVQGGNIVLEGAVRDVYMVMQDGDYDTVTSYTRLQDYKATFVDTGYTLSLNLPGDNTQEAQVNNLLGSGDFRVTNTDESSGVVRVVLNNEAWGSEPANTLLEGSISAGNAVQLVKAGEGTLTVGGSLTTDWLEIDDGALRLTGQGNKVASLHGDGSLELEGSLEISGNSLGFSGTLNGSGVLELNGALPARGEVGALSGNGSFMSAGETFTVQNVQDSTFSGSLSEGNGAGVLTVMQGAGTFALQQVHSSPAWSLQNQGNLILHQTDNVLSLNKLELLDASSTTIVLNTDGDVKVFSLSSLLVQDGAAVTLQSTGTLPLELSEDGTMVLGQVESADLGADAQVPLTLGSGTVFQGIDAAWLSVVNGLLLFNAWRDETNLYETVAASANASTGAQMLWRIPNEVLRESPDLRKLTEALDILAAEGNARTADQVLAAAAGAGTAAMGTALVGDVERQLQSIRNRTTSMGVNPAMEHDFPLFNAWANAEGDRSELDASGTEAGYTLSSWGGTVGFDVDVNDYLTAGMAFSAMYGDYESKSPDHAKGDIDTCYLSLFGRYAARRWTHTLVGTIGWADVELKRSVDYGAGSYSTSGSSDGLGFGMLYELGYVIPLDEDSSSCLQPIVNISYRHAGIDAYNESGSDAGLHVGRQDMDVVTFGLGARAQTYAMEDVYNRRCLLEGRVLFKLDAGDVRSHSNVSLLADRARGGRVRSAEMGRFGVEMGAGMTIPLGVDAGSLFMDAGVGLRSRAYEVNGTVGYRLSF